MKRKAKRTKGPVPVVAGKGYVKLGNVTFSYSPYHSGLRSYRAELDRMVALVKAAPDLLAALDDFRDILQCLVNNEDSREESDLDHYHQVLDRRIDDARALLSALDAGEGGKHANAN